MRHVFDTHNTLGRLCDEPVYRRCLAAKLGKLGLCSVWTEVPVTVSWKNFRKLYFPDLIVAAGNLYELKATAALAPVHRAQLLHYLMLLELSHGKLLNFRTPSVTWEFLNTHLTLEQRRQFSVSDNRWDPRTARCEQLQQTLLEILREWGAFLELTLYLEALTWFLGGESAVIRAIPLTHEGTSLGHQRMHLVSPEIAFCLSALPGELQQAEAHYRRLLALTELEALHWINLHQSQISLITLRQ